MALKFILIVIFSSITTRLCHCEEIVLESSKFSEAEICDVQARIDEGCSYKVPNSKSLIQCLVLCFSDIDCMGASLDVSNTCYHHNIMCPKVTGCTAVDTQHHYLARYCIRSYWNRETQSCNCDNDIYGARCNIYPRDCRVLMNNGYSEGNYWTYVDTDRDGENPMRVNCYIKPDTSYSNVKIFQNTGDFDFNKTWVEYRDGFVFDDENYWSGLRGMHAMNQIGCTRLVFAVFFDYPTKTLRYRRYYNFDISGEDDKFPFTFSSSSEVKAGTLSPTSVFGECLEPLVNVEFSTWDSDSDGVTGENCAERNGHGWWYNGTCDNDCNALGWGYPYLNIKESYQMMKFIRMRFDRHFEKVLYSWMYLDCFY